VMMAEEEEMRVERKRAAEDDVKRILIVGFVLMEVMVFVLLEMIESWKVKVVQMNVRA
jgi:hypothetical protein